MRLLRFSHRWLGIGLALPLLIQGLTGAVLTAEPWFEDGGHGGAAAPGSVNAMVAAALAAAPGTRLNRYIPPATAHGPATVMVQPADRPRGGALLVQIDPATATVIGAPTPPGGVMSWIRRLHNNWLLQELGGRQFAGWLGVGLVVLVLIGVPLWWPAPGWRAGFTVPRRAKGALLQRRLHGAMGGWLMVLMLLTGATGIVQGFPQTTRAVLGLEGNRPGGTPAAGGTPNAAREGRRDGPRAAATPPDFDAAIALAQATAPGTVLRLMFAPPGGAQLRVVLGPPGTDGQTTATSVTVDAAGRRVMAVQAAGAVSPAETLMRWSRDLHVGEGFGPVWRALTFMGGIALPGFGLTGVLLWWLKRRNRARVARRAAEAMVGSAAE